MEIEADREWAKANQPQAYAEALANLRSGSSRRRGDPEETLAWSWGVARALRATPAANLLNPAAAPAPKADDSLRESDPAAHVEAALAAGELALTLRCSLARPARVAAGPVAPEVAERFRLEPARPARGLVLNVWEEALPQRGWPAGIWQSELIGVYEAKGPGGEAELTAVDVDGMGKGLDPRRRRAGWGGALGPSGLAAFKALGPEGGEFRARGKRHRRLGEAEARALVEGPVWLEGAFRIDAQTAVGREAGPARVAASTPVFGQGAKRADRVVQVGTASSLGIELSARAEPGRKPKP